MKKIPHIFLLSLLLPLLVMNCLVAERVKILIQGDTQKIMNAANGKQDNFVPLMAKVLTDPITMDADFILQVGDIVESDLDNSDRPQQYSIAREGWFQLNGRIPYVLNLGNNDDAAEFIAAFDQLPEPFSETQDGRNFAYIFNAGGVKWLIISVRFHRSDEDNSSEINWAKKLIEQNADCKVIFIKHEVNKNSPIVNQLKSYPNVVFVLSGHTQSQHEILTGNEGNKIGWIRTCHHNANLDSYFRMLLIDTQAGTVSSHFYSPQYEKFWHDPTAPFHDCERSVPWAQTGFDFGVAGAEPEIKGNDAKFISLEVPCCVFAGNEFKATAVVENTGTDWDANRQQNRYKLGSESPKGNNDWGPGTARTPVSNPVAFGGFYQFEISCIAPENEGYYNFQRRMVQDGIGWFGEFSENRIVYVTTNKVINDSFESGSASWSFEGDAHISSEIKRSGNASLVLPDASTKIRQSVKLEKQTDYEVSAWIKGSMSETSGKVYLGVFDASSGQKKVQFKIDPDKATEWTKFKGQFNSGYSDFVILQIYGHELEDVVHVDDVVLMASRVNTASLDSAYIVNAYKGQPYRAELDVSDFDRGSLDYSLLSKPGWLHFDFNTGILSGTPAEKDIGVHAVTLGVASAEKNKKIAFTIRVFDTSPYLLWAEKHAVSLETDDNDGDGLKNFLEFALGGNPVENDALARIPKLSPDGSGFNFNFRRNQLTVDYIVQKSVDLKSWSDYRVVNDSDALVGDACNVWIPASDEKQFFRLAIDEK